MYIEVITELGEPSRDSGGSFFWRNIFVKRIVGKDLPIVVTRDIGHGTDSKGIIIGQEIYLKE